jgi:uncharacterized protein YqkB
MLYIHNLLIIRYLNMKKIALVILVGLLSCDNAGLSVVNDTSVRVHYVDENGASILLKSNPEFTVDDLRIYYYDSEMEYVLHSDGRLDNPLFISQEDSIYISMLPVFGELDGTYVDGGRSTSYLDFGNGDIDTIQVAGRISGSITQIHDVWYNGKQVQSVDFCEFMPCGFTIVK